MRQNDKNDKKTKWPGRVLILFSAGAVHCVQTAGKNVHQIEGVGKLSFETGKGIDHFAAVGRGH